MKVKVRIEFENESEEEIVKVLSDFQVIVCGKVFDDFEIDF